MRTVGVGGWGGGRLEKMRCLLWFVCTVVDFGFVVVRIRCRGVKPRAGVCISTTPG